MKIETLAVFLAFNLATLQESPAFVDCGFGALCYSEELPQDGPVPEGASEDADASENAGETPLSDLSV